MPLTPFIYALDPISGDFGPDHPFSPERITRTHALLQAYGAFQSGAWLKLQEPVPATRNLLERVHSASYLDALMELNDGRLRHSAIARGLGTTDMPLYPGIWDTALLAVGGTVQAAESVLRTGGRAIHLAGGLHHAHRERAGGFCALNDLAVAIQFLLDQGVQRIACVDIDAHHGDGTQEFFYEDPRVLTISMHEAGRTLYPGTGEAMEIGDGPGEGYNINIPLQAGTGDDVYLWAFEQAVLPVLEVFQPDILITQAGCDAHVRDPLPHLRLTSRAYESVFQRLDALNRPWIVTGGGGNDLDTVPRLWTMACSIVAGEELSNSLPEEWTSRYGGTTLRDPVLSDISDQTLAATRVFVEPSITWIRERVLPRLA